MVRRKNKAQMPNLDAESPDNIEVPPSTAPIRVSKRASNSVHRTKIVQKEEMPVLEKAVSPTKPDFQPFPSPRSGRRSAKEPTPAPPDVVPETEVAAITTPKAKSRRRSAKVAVVPTSRSGRLSARQSTSAAEVLTEVSKPVEAEKETVAPAPDSTEESPAPEIIAETAAEPEQEENVEPITVPSTVEEEKTSSPAAPVAVSPEEIKVPDPVKPVATKKRKSIVLEKPSPLLLDSTIAGRAGKRQKKEKKIFDPSTEPTKKKVRLHKHVDGEKEYLLKSPPKLTAGYSEPAKKSSPQRPVPTMPSQRKLTPTSSKKARQSDATTAIKQKFSLFCYICLGSKGNLEQICSHCGSSAHQKCLEDQQYIASVKILGANWVCQNCLNCCVCHQNGTLGKKTEMEAFVCNSCKNTYHAKCHRPSLVNKPIVKVTWKCHTCAEMYRASRLLIRSDELGGEVPSPDLTEFNGFSELDIKSEPVRSVPIVRKKPKPPVAASSSSSGSTSRTYSTTTSESSSTDRQMPTNVALKAPTMMQNWSVDDVYVYFSKFFPEYASLFREQEIDGAVLLLMRRSDVLKGFKHIKLGPAINIYRHIVMLQTKNTDPRHTWY